MILIELIVIIKILVLVEEVTVQLLQIDGVGMSGIIQDQQVMTLHLVSVYIFLLQTMRGQINLQKKKINWKVFIIM